MQAASLALPQNLASGSDFSEGLRQVIRPNGEGRDARKLLNLRTSKDVAGRGPLIHVGFSGPSAI